MKEKLTIENIRKELKSWSVLEMEQLRLMLSNLKKEDYESLIDSLLKEKEKVTA